MTVHFRPALSGGWLALTAGETLLVIGAPADQPAVDALWDAVGSTGGFQRVLDVLTSNGLAATPPFALFDGAAASLRVIVRGEVAATVTNAAGSAQIDGSGVTTWREQTWADVSSVGITVVGAGPADGVAQLPLGSGGAWVASLRLSFAASGGLDTAAGGPLDQRGAADGVDRRVAAHGQLDERVAADGVDQPAAADGVDQQVAADRPLDQQPIEFDPEATVTEAPTERIDPPETTPDTPADGYDYLFGATMFRGVAEAAVQESPAEEEATAELAGDHDGHTVLTSDIAKLRAERRAKRGAPTPPPVAPPAARVFLALSSGTREPLTQPILVGRSPSVSQVSGGQMPRLLTVGTPDQDISRTHVRFVLEGGTVVVTDLHSRNGTLVVLPGKEPQKLRAGEPTSVITGTVVDLGGGVTLTVEETADDA
ncbi:FHA domain-containing protein [Glaciihabitans sp. INWT7]|uniref:FHA domain-containing protein n=1 Tax=Glaciihabitans sp. INWT7 TaxID=2596912 RepID=UPI00162730A7|nr:FHA domain-containing protein [Glaciihabitans sp. INWT7]QNE47452.1 FHA domain-containing protein [Glaciihabitans sp. INWT7]